MMKSDVISAWAAYAKDNDIRQNSSSGGIFTILSENILRNNGIVYGVAMSDDCHYAKYKRVDNYEDLAELRGSKYLQARVGDTFKYVKKDLEDGKRVLFSGVGCQINGLKGFLGKEYDSLLCIDVICHGTPSENIWQMYLNDFEKRNGNVQSVSFRSKQEGWERFGMKENSVFISKDRDTYMQFFLRNYDLRPSCYRCHAKTLKRSDLTLADFWGINNVAPEMNDGKGTSLVLVRTNKGKIAIDDIQDKLIIKSVPYEAGVKSNPAEYSSAYKPKQRTTLFADMKNLNYQDLVNKYGVNKPCPIPRYKKVYFGIRALIKIFLKPRGGKLPELNYGMYLKFVKRENWYGKSGKN